MKKLVCLAIFLAALLLGAVATAESISINDTTKFPDEKFRDYLLKYVDGNKNQYLDDDEIENTTSLDLTSYGIKNLKGIECFKKVEMIQCHDNELTELDVSALSKLENLDCSSNKLTSLKLSPSLKIITCTANQLSTLDVDNMDNLVDLACNENKLSSLNVTKCKNLYWLVHNARRTPDKCYGGAHTWGVYEGVDDPLQLYVDPQVKVIAGDFTSERAGWPDTVYVEKATITVQYPEVGSSSKSGDPKLTVPDNEHYWVEDAAWLLLVGGSGEMTFEAGGTYYIGFFLETEDRYAFSDNVSVDVINGVLNGSLEVIEDSGLYVLKGIIEIHIPTDASQGSQGSEGGQGGSEGGQGSQGSQGSEGGQGGSEGGQGSQGSEGGQGSQGEQGSQGQQEGEAQSDIPASIDLGIKKLTLKNAKEQTITAMLANPNDAIESVKSSKTNYAKVSFSGNKITVSPGKKAGKSTITVKTKMGASAKLTVTVKEGWSLDEKSITLKKGEKYKIKLSAVPSSVKIKSCESSKPKVAKVDKKGKITAKKKGKATITVTLSNGKTLKLKVKVE